jgi:hypothetical protein
VLAPAAPHCGHGDHFDFLPTFAAHPQHGAVRRQVGLATDRCHFDHALMILAFSALRRLIGLFSLRCALCPNATAPVFGDARQTIRGHAPPHRIAKSLCRQIE